MNSKLQFLCTKNSFLITVVFTSAWHSLIASELSADQIALSFRQGDWAKVVGNIYKLKSQVAENNGVAIKILQETKIKIAEEKSTIYFDITLNALAVGTAALYLYKDSFDDEESIYKSSIASSRLVAWFSIYNSINSLINLRVSHRKFNRNKHALLGEIDDILEQQRDQ